MLGATEASVEDSCTDERLENLVHESRFQDKPRLFSDRLLFLVCLYPAASLRCLCICSFYTKPAGSIKGAEQWVDSKRRAGSNTSSMQHSHTLAAQNKDKRGGRP